LIASSILPCNRFVINYKDIILGRCLQWPFAIVGNLSLQKWGIPFATLSIFILQQTLLPKNHQHTKTGLPGFYHTTNRIELF
jgi:hypothetical protein